MIKIKKIVKYISYSFAIIEIEKRTDDIIFQAGFYDIHKQGYDLCPFQVFVENDERNIPRSSYHIPFLAFKEHYLSPHTINIYLYIVHFIGNGVFKGNDEKKNYINEKKKKYLYVYITTIDYIFTKK